MNKRVATAVAGILWLLSSSAAFAEWHDYVYADDGFTITAPAEPVRTSEDMTTNNGPTQLHSYSSEADGGSVAFMAGASHYGTALDVATSLSGAKQGQIESFKGQIVSEGPVSLGDVQGLQYELLNPSDGTGVRARVFVVGQTLYQLVVIWEKDKGNSADTDRFLNSFRLLRN